MKIILFKPDHLDLIEDLTGWGVDKEAVLAANKGLCDRSVILTMIEDGRIVSIFGIRYLFGGVGQAFNYPSKYLRSRHFRAIKKELDDRMFLYHRIQTHSLVGKWEKWHKMMGFTKECEIKNFVDGEDRTLWGRIS